MEWMEELTDPGKVRWSKKGTLSLKNSLPDVVPVPVQFYLSSIRPNDLANALAYIQEGATHYFAQGYAGIVFYGDSDDAWLSSSSSMSSEEETSNLTESSNESTDETSENDPTSSSYVETDEGLALQPGEVGFCVGHKRRAKYKMREKDFLNVMKTLLIVRREQNHKDIPGQQDFLQYVDEISKDEDDCQPRNVHRHITEVLSPPSNLNLTDDDDNNVRLSWMSNEVDHFIVRYWPEEMETDVTEQITSGTEMSTLLRDLQAATTYVIAVSAERNGIQSKFVQDSFSTRPIKPPKLSIDITDTTLTAHWESPDPATGIDWYKLCIECVDTSGLSPTKEYCVNVGKSPTSGATQPTDFHHMFCDLSSETNYRVSLFSVSDTPAKPLYSPPLSQIVRTGPVTVKGLAVDSSSNSIVARWRPVKGHRSLSNYLMREEDPKLRVSIRKSHDLQQQSHILEAGLTQETFTNLQPDTEYVIIVTPLRDTTTEQSSAITLKTKSSTITVTERTTTSIAVKWKASIDDSRYTPTIEPLNRGLDNVIQPVSGTLNTCIFDGLKPGTAYRVVLKSECSTQTCITSTRPALPKYLNIIPSSNESLTVKWDSPDGSVGYFRVYVDPDQIHMTSNNECTFSNLTPGRLYTITLETCSNGEYSSPISELIRMLPCKPILSVSNTTDDSITVNCEPLEGDSDSCEVMVALSTNPTAYVDGVTNLETKSHWEHCFGALKPGTVYEIFAIARSGEKHSEKVTTTVRTCVGVPADLRIVAQDHLATIGWSAARGYVDEYRIVLSSVEGIVTKRSLPASDDLKLNFWNLVPGRLYSASVSSVIIDKQNDNVVAKSFTASVDFRAVVKKPNVTVERGSVETNSLKISWHDVRGERDRYRVSISPPDSDMSESVITAPNINNKERLSHVFENLTPGKMYTITVVAITGKVESEGDICQQRTKPGAPKLREVNSVVHGAKYFTEWDHSDGEFDKYKLTVEPVVNKERKHIPQRTFCTEDNSMLVDLVPGIKYHFSLLAVSGEENSLIDTSTVTVLPAQPLDVKVSSTDTTITVTWKEPEGAKAGYIVKLLSKQHGYDKKEFVKTLQYSFKKLTPGRLYEASVTTASVKENGGRVMSQPECKQVQTEVSKANIEMIGGGYTDITVQWFDVSGDKTSYKLWINPGDGDDSIKHVLKATGKRTLMYKETFTGLQPGQKYQIFCQTISGDKSSEESVIVVQTAVSPPQDVHISTALEDSLSVTWSHAKGDKDSYKLRLLLDKIEVASDTVPVPLGEDHGKLSYTFQNLIAGCNYELEISTLSGKQYSVVNRHFAQTRPSPPQHVTVAKHGTEGLRVAWEGAQGRVTTYVVDISPSDGWKRQTVKVNPIERSYQWTYNQLTPGRNYTVRVTAVSGVVESESVVVEETTVVAKPENFRIEHREETSLTLSWNAARGDKAGYLTTIEPLVSDPSSNEVVPTHFIDHKEGLMSYTFKNLQPGRQYLMTLKTESCGHYSEGETVKARALVSPPKILKVTDITTDEMTLVWSEADGDKDYYQIKISPADGLNPDWKVQKDEDRLHTFSGLTPGKNYDVSVCTYSGEDESHCKTISERTIPNAPQNVVLKIVDKSIEVAWQPVRGELESYLLHLKPRKDTHENRDEVWHTVGKCEPTSHIFPHLTCGRQYTITVQTLSGNRQSSPFTISQRLPIDTPKDLKESSRAERRIAIAWESATGDKDCYHVKLLNGDEFVKEEDTADTTWSSDGLVPGTLYTVCVQTVCEGETSGVTAIQVRTVACSPTSLYVGNVTERTISVSWPDAVGNKDKYSVQICDEEGIEVGSTELPSTILEKTFKHLVPGRLYQICIKSLCDNDDESTSSPICQPQRTNVAQPGNIVMENIELDRLSFSWGKALGDVDYYIADVSSCDPEENIPKLDSVSKDSCLGSTVDGLTAGRLYSITVTAVSGDDCGKPRTIRVRTKVDKPRHPKIAAVGERTLVVNWDHATGDNDRYKLTIDPEHSICIPVDANDELSQTFTNLVPGTFYRISITTIKGDDVSDVSRCEGWTRPLPSGKISLSKISEKSITVAWDHVPEGGYEGYKVKIDPDDAGECLLHNQTHVFNGLTPGREYAVSVVTVCGDSLISRRITSRKRTTVNTPKLIVESHNVTKTSIPVRWKRSEGDCDEYKLTIYSGTDETERKSVRISNESSRSFGYAFDKLVPGREYTVSLVARSGQDNSKPSRCTQRTIIATPASLILSSTEDCIYAEWENAEGDASDYLVTLSTSSDDEKKEKFIRFDEPCKTVFDQLVPGRIYLVTIQTVVKPIRRDAVFSSPVSCQKRTDVKPPKLNLDMVTKTSIQVKWPDVLGDRDEYRLHISPTDLGPVRLPVAIEKSFQDHHHTFQDLVPGKRYEITAVTVSGDQDSKPETINVRTSVCPPKDIRSGSTRAEIVVQWDEPDGEYDRFHLRLSPPDAQHSEVSKDKAELCHTFTNLVSGRKYKITIVTMNEGVRSTEVTISIQTKVADVDPADLVVVSDGEGQLRASWKHCEGDKRGYLIVITPNDTTPGSTRYVKLNLSDPLEYKFVDLVPGRMYSITLYAVSYEERSNGISQNVRATVAHPRDVCIHTKTERSLSVSWNGSKGEVDGYLVSISDALATLQEVCIKHKGEDILMSYTFQELTPGRMYTVSVTAIREDDSSLTISLPPSRTLVSQPNDVHIVEETVDSIRVSWLEADGCKDRYHVDIIDAHDHHHQEPEEVALQKAKLDANNAPQYMYVFKNLTAGKRYLIRVLAESGNDKSSWASTFGRTIPLPPKELEVETTHDNNIIVRWKSVEGEFDKHSLFLYSEKVTTGVSDSEVCDRATDKPSNEGDDKSTFIHKKWGDVQRNQETAFTFCDLEHGRLYIIQITTKSGDKESEPKQVMIRTTVDNPKDLREIYHDETCIAVEWNHARGVKDEYIVEVTANNHHVDSKCIKADSHLKCTFQGLYPGRLYIVSIRTICGESFSKPFERHMRTTAIPPERISIEEDDVKERAIRITWPEAQCDKDHYRVTLIPEGNGDQGEIQEDEIGSDVQIYNFSNLIPGQLYKILICTLTDRKECDSKPLVIHRRTRVAKVNNLQVSEIDFTSLKVKWEPADGVQEGYKIDLNHDGLQQMTKYVDKVGPGPFDVVFDDLTEGRLYTVNVITISGDERVTTGTSQRTKVRSPTD